MKTLVLQVCVSLVRAAFALMALRAARSMRPWENQQRLSWMATGITFAVYAAVMLAQDYFSVRAYFAGIESPVYAFYRHFSPVVEHARTFLMFGFYGALLALPFRERWSTRAWW
ncbi:MAG TPA: hypothetical protein VFQ39_07400, partial [Longimicrobium sp.]|nr:hypothetical protein [Longimicrobium sp.]